MPDSTLATISATEMGGLLGVSPYVTPFMLGQKFINKVDIDGDPDSRMRWGLLLEPLVIQEAGKMLGLEVSPNRDANGIQPYVRRNLLGCTRDATVWDPSRGPGAMETKCIFDYTVWMQKWEGGKRVPPEYEIQLQVQMYVGDGVTPYNWGIIPAWVCGDLKVDFKREPDRELWALFEETAEKFFADVKAKKVPDPFGKPLEVPLISRLYPPVTKKVRDYREEPDAYRVAEEARMMQYHADQATLHEGGKDDLKAKLRGLLLDNEELWLPHGIIVKQKPHGKGIRVTVYVPPNIPEGDISFFDDVVLPS